MDYLHDNDAAAMRLQEEFNDHAKMEASDETLARELQKELEGTGEEGGYRNGSELAIGKSHLLYLGGTGVSTSYTQPHVQFCQSHYWLLQ